MDIMTEEFLYLPKSPYQNQNHETQNKGISPAQHRILPTLRRTILHVRPPLQKILMQHHARQFASDGAIDVFDYGKVCGEEDVEIALLDLNGNENDISKTVTCAESEVEECVRMAC